MRKAVQRFERKAWDRLIDYLIKLPPLLSDDWRLPGKFPFCVISGGGHEPLARTR